MDTSLTSATLAEISELIEKLTTSGRTTLDEKNIKQLKRICRASDNCVRQAYRLIMVQLEKDHAEIRRSASLIVDELFLRSHCFRELLLDDFQRFMELTLETDLTKPLPPPVPAAKDLKKQCTLFIHNWFVKFGDTYKKLALGHNFLRHCKKIDFANIQAQTLAERRLEEEKRAKQEVRLRSRADAAAHEMNEMSAEIRACLIEAESCMSLLVPDPNEFDVLATAEDDDSGQKTSVKNEAVMTSTSTGSETGDGLPKTNLKTPDASICSLVSNSADEFSAGSMSTIENIHLPSIKNSAVSPRDQEKIPLLFADQISDISTEASEKGQPRTDCGTASDKESDARDMSNNPDLFRTPNHTSSSCDLVGDEEDSECGDSGSEQDEDFDEVVCDTGVRSVRGHGILNYKTTLTITINPGLLAIKETKDNVDLLVTLRDQVTLANHKFLPSVRRWLDAFTRAGQHEADIRAALDLRMDLETMLRKANKLDVTEMKQSAGQTCDDSDTEDDDFEEVPEKEGFELNLPEHLADDYKPSPRPVKARLAEEWQSARGRKDREMDAEDPTTWAATLKRLRENQEFYNLDHGDPRPSTSKGDPAQRKNQEELLQTAPVIPFGTDLYHWGESVEAPMVVRNDPEVLRWWKAQEVEDKVDVHALAAIKQRTINFVGKFEPVKWRCRAPLPSGKLCTRMDRYKCPFHGKIIPRDTHGVVNGKEKPEAVETEKSKSNCWDDPELQADIMAATGVDLTLKKRKGKGKGKGTREKKYPNLTDIKSLGKNSSRKRLEMKVFSSGTVKRVAESLDDLDAKRYKDKFGNNFNYSCQH